MKHKKGLKNISSVKILLGVSLFFAAFHIYQYTLFVQASYQKQQAERHLVALQEKKMHRMQEIEEMKSRTLIRHYAVKELGMKVLSLRQVKRLSCQQGSA